MGSNQGLQEVVMENLLHLFLGVLISKWGDLRKVRFRIHRATFIHSQEECFFCNITNLSRNREIEITHLWFDIKPKIHLINMERPLPKRLKPDEPWETWIPTRDIPEKYHSNLFYRGCIRLSTGANLRSRIDKKVPGYGTVPGATR